MVAGWFGSLLSQRLTVDEGVVDLESEPKVGKLNFSLKGIT